MDLHVETRHVTMLPEWQEKIDEETARLEEHHPGIIHHLRVTLIKTEHHRHGLFEVHVVASVPRDTVTVKHTGEQMRPLLVSCFDIMDRQLTEYDQRRQGKEKVHEAPPVGTVRTIVRTEGYGFIENLNGDEIYFHANAVHDIAFEDLAEGDAVSYGVEMGGKGLQATWVRPA